MKDEIKEILEALKPQDEEFTKAGIKEYPLALSAKEQKILRDYITNLQEKYKKSCETYQQALDETMSEKMDLEKENERLKMDIRYWEDKWQYTKFSDKDYKTRIDEAIKFVNENAISDVQWWINKDTKITCHFAKDTDPRDLLEILQGNNN